MNYIDEGKNGYLYLFKIINNQTQIWLRHNNQNQYLFDLPQQRIDSVVIGPDNTIYASSENKVYTLNVQGQLAPYATFASDVQKLSLAVSSWGLIAVDI